MRILINALFLIPNHVGGTETYARGLVDGLAAIDTENEYVLCVGPEAASTFRLPNTRWRLIASPTASARRPVRLGVEQLWLPLAANAVGADVIHSVGYTAPVSSTQRRVTTIHDMNYRRHPEALSVTQRMLYSMLIPLAAQRSHDILTMTRAARSDVIHFTRVRASKVHITPGAPRAWWPGDPRDDARRLAAIGVDEPYVLSVAAAYPHKNVQRLMQAFPLHGQADGSVRLVVAGLGGRAYPQLLAEAAHRSDFVKVLGWVDDATLASLYRRAVALAFPSLYEGFGLPIVESMALGTAVLTSNYGAMAEVADDAAELVDPYDVQAIRAGLQRLVRDEQRRAELRQLGRSRAGRFSWSRTAELTLEVYRRRTASWKTARVEL